mmetsp:Transcript_23472/g.65756  ORF Transcript_23472/g.65756 Transcript_23472/m.65756 type:complete len:494 (-) Transcript_23472:85-1566(-)
MRHIHPSRVPGSTHLARRPRCIGLGACLKKAAFETSPPVRELVRAAASVPTGRARRDDFEELLGRVVARPVSAVVVVPGGGPAVSQHVRETTRVVLLGILLVAEILGVDVLDSPGPAGVAEHHHVPHRVEHRHEARGDDDAEEARHPVQGDDVAHVVGAARVVEGAQVEAQDVHGEDVQQGGEEDPRDLEEELRVVQDAHGRRLLGHDLGRLPGGHAEGRGGERAVHVHLLAHGRHAQLEAAHAAAADRGDAPVVLPGRRDRLEHHPERPEEHDDQRARGEGAHVEGDRVGVSLADAEARRVLLRVAPVRREVPYRGCPRDHVLRHRGAELEQPEGHADPENHEGPLEAGVVLAGQPYREEQGEPDAHERHDEELDAHGDEGLEDDRRVVEHALDGRVDAGHGGPHPLLAAAEEPEGVEADPEAEGEPDQLERVQPREGEGHDEVHGDQQRAEADREEAGAQERPREALEEGEVGHPHHDGQDAAHDHQGPAV